MRHLVRGTIVPALALAACTPTPDGNETAVANDTAPALPAFAVDTATALAGIAALGEPWAGAAKSDPMQDAKTGGRVTVLRADGGSAQVFSRPQDKVWQIRLVAGAPNKCAGSAPLVAALPKAVALVKPGTVLSPADRLALGNGMTDLKPTTRSLDGMTVTVVGGCTHWLTIAVPAAPG